MTFVEYLYKELQWSDGAEVSINCNKRTKQILYQNGKACENASPILGLRVLNFPDVWLITFLLDCSESGTDFLPILGYMCRFTFEAKNGGYTRWGYAPGFTVVMYFNQLNF